MGAAAEVRPIDVGAERPRQRKPGRVGLFEKHR